jgi:gas vesicle protein
MNESNKMPYLLAAGAIGGAAAYLFMTNSGRQVRQNVLSADGTSAIPDKIEDARLFIERRGKDVGDRVRGIVDRAKEAVDAAKEAYEESGQSLNTKMSSLERTNGQVLGNIHRAIDNVNKTIHTIEKSVLDPIYQATAIFRGVDRGVRRFVGNRGSDGSMRSTTDTSAGIGTTEFGGTKGGFDTGFDSTAERTTSTTSFYDDQRRRMG